MFDNTKKYGIITKDGYVSVGAPNPDGGIATRYDVKKYVSANAQEKLVSGTNIKTINNQSILGSGNINISGGGTSDDVYTKQEADNRFAAKAEISDMLTKTEASNTYQPKGEYATTEQLNNKSDKFSQVDGGTGEVTQEINPNTFYKFGECTTLNLTLGAKVDGIYNEYMFQFTSGATATTLGEISGVKWVGDNTINPNTTYVVVIHDGTLAVLGGA